MAISVVQSLTEVQDSNVSSSTSGAFGSTTTSGNNIVTYGGFWRSGGTTITVSDSASNSWNNDQTSPIPSGDQGRSQIASSENITGAASHTLTMTYTGAGTYAAWGATEISGLKTSGAHDSGAGGTSSNNNPGSTDASVTGAGSSAQADNIVIVCCYVEMTSSNINFTSAPTTGYTAFWTENDATSYGGIQPSYKIISASETSSANWSHDDAGAGGWSNSLAVYQQAAAGGATGKSNPLDGPLGGPLAGPIGM